MFNTSFWHLQSSLHGLFVSLSIPGIFTPLLTTKSRPMLGDHDHWAVRPLCTSVCMDITEDPWHSQLLPSVWQWSCHYLLGTRDTHNSCRAFDSGAVTTCWGPVTLTTLAERLTVELSLLVTICFNEVGLSGLRYSLIESDIGMPTNCNIV